MSTLILLLLGSCGGSGEKFTAAPRGGSTSPGSGGLPGGGGNPAGGLGGGGAVDPAPLSPQDLRDLDGENIGPWGPVTATFYVQVGQAMHIVKQLSSSDPFTGLYQLADGTLVISNEPLVNIVSGNFADPPEIVDWATPPEGPYDIFQGEIIITFVSSATQQQIEQLIAAHNLHVIISHFTALDPPLSGNEIAIFHCDYDQSEFPSIDDALAYFNNHALVEDAVPNLARAYTADYAQGPPADEFYLADESEYIDALEIDASYLVDMGPPYGGELSRQVVAVMDNGVFREHPDFGYLTSAYKLAEVGVNCHHESIVVRRQGGDPVVDDTQRQGKVSHGTQCAGMITAFTNPEGVLWDQGVPGAAPSICVMPIRLEVNEDDYTYVTSSIFHAIRGLMLYFRHGLWQDDEAQDVKVRVVNISFSTLDYAYTWYIEPAVNADLLASDRLYVGSAGNDAAPAFVYPAAFENVLGVTGLWVVPEADVWTTPYDENWFALIPETRPGYSGPWRGSNYRPDPSVYPISGVYGFCRTDVNGEPDGRTADIGRSLSPPAGNSPYGEGGLYDHFSGTSACAPQVAGLAALLYSLRDEEVDYHEVWGRIVTTRNQGIERVLSVPMAGPVMYDLALIGWIE